MSWRNEESCVRTAIDIPPISMDTALVVVATVVIIAENYAMERHGNLAHCTEHAAEKLAGAHRSYAGSRPTNTQREVAEFVPATKRPSQTGIEQRELAAWDESAIGTPNADHSAKHLGCGCGGIALGHRVTSRDPRNAILSESRFNQPMNKEAVIAQN
jgi:hypothetical protein